MKSVITQQGELISSISAFKTKIQKISASSSKREWAFPNGEKNTCETFVVKTNLGTLLVGFPKKWNSRQAHLLSLNNRGPALSPDVEINIPNGLNRNVSGVYVKDGKEILICHRGRFTAYRGSIQKDYSLGFFKKWLVTVDDNHKTNELITVASLSSPSLVDDLALFVNTVSEMKDQFKSDTISNKDVRPKKAKAVSWKDGEEFEGIKSRAGNSNGCDYEYLHGPLCNSLKIFVSSELKSRGGVLVLSNTNVDLAIVRKSTDKALAIFEVKTAGSMSPQLYSALGQLQYYKYKYGDESTALFLVLPEAAKTDMKSHEFFRIQGIRVVFAEAEKFSCADGSDFATAIQSAIRA